jgi:multidrug transporter EmrE-like cation transporter
MNKEILLLAVAIILNAGANILIKAGMIRINQENPPDSLFRYMIGQPFLYISILSFGLALVLYSLVLKTMNLSVAYPVMVSSGLILVILVSYFFLNESIRWIQILGFGLIIAGVWFVAK